MDGGFDHLNNRNNALSYFVGLDTALDFPQTMLSGDRNIHVSRSRTCGLVNVPATHLHPDDPAVGFTNGVHRFSGQILLSDGSVQNGDSAMIRRLVVKNADFSPDTTYSSSYFDLLIPGQPTVIP